MKESQVGVGTIRLIEAYNATDPGKTPIWALVLEGHGVVLAVNVETKERGETLMKLLSDCPHIDFLLGARFNGKNFVEVTCGKPRLNS